MNECAICGKSDATHGNYCKPCLDRETDDMDPEDLEAAEEYLNELEGLTV